VLTLGGIFIIIVPSIVGTLIVAPLTASSILIGISISKLLSLILKIEEGVKIGPIAKFYKE
jgi:riboflavin transporter FmnP